MEEKQKTRFEQLRNGCICKLIIGPVLLGRAGTSSSHQGRLFGADDRVIFCLFVLLEPVQVLFRHRHIRENGLDRALRETRVAVDAGIGVNQQAVGCFVKRFDRTDCGAVGVFAFNTRGSDDIGHSALGRDESTPKLKT